VSFCKKGTRSDSHGILHPEDEEPPMRDPDPIICHELAEAITTAWTMAQQRMLERWEPILAIVRQCIPPEPRPRKQYRQTKWGRVPAAQRKR
jgi:hypothetical protein